jgi:hypothetical protein
MYIRCCEKYPSEKPTLSKLVSISNNSCKRSRWSRLLLDFNFCLGLKEELIKKLNYAKTKDKKDFWENKINDFDEYIFKKAIINWGNKIRQLNPETLSGDDNFEEEI